MESARKNRATSVTAWTRGIKDCVKTFLSAYACARVHVWKLTSLSAIRVLVNFNIGWIERKKMPACEGRHGLDRTLRFPSSINHLKRARDKSFPWCIPRRIYECKNIATRRRAVALDDGEAGLRYIHGIARRCLRETTGISMLKSFRACDPYNRSRKPRSRSQLTQKKKKNSEDQKRRTSSTRNERVYPYIYTRNTYTLAKTWRPCECMWEQVRPWGSYTRRDRLAQPAPLSLCFSIFSSLLYTRCISRPIYIHTSLVSYIA